MGEKKGTLFYYPPFETNETRGCITPWPCLPFALKKYYHKAKEEEEL
jgi:hypothetical protein